MVTRMHGIEKPALWLVNRHESLFSKFFLKCIEIFDSKIYSNSTFNDILIQINF